MLSPIQFYRKLTRYSIPEYIDRLRGIKPDHNKDVFDFYKLCYAFANGIDNFPVIAFKDGEYTIEHNTPSNYPRRVTYRQLKYMGINLLKRDHRIHSCINLSFNKDTYDLIYSTLTLNEALFIEQYDITFFD
jgi:hypothetical protein